MDEELRRTKLTAVHGLVDTLERIGLTPFGNVWEFELELYEYWNITGRP